MGWIALANLLLVPASWFPVVAHEGRQSLQRSVLDAALFLVPVGALVVINVAALSWWRGSRTGA